MSATFGGEDYRDSADGGPAFPKLPDEIRNGSSGMSLRDWFAGQITAAAITNAQGLAFLDDEERHVQFGGLARISYALADAMLAARKARP